jgi:hypothetical protein
MVGRIVVCEHGISRSLPISSDLTAGLLEFGIALELWLNQQEKNEKSIQTEMEDAVLPAEVEQDCFAQSVSNTIQKAR